MQEIVVLADDLRRIGEVLRVAHAHNTTLDLATGYRNFSAVPKAAPLTAELERMMTRVFGYIDSAEPQADETPEEEPVAE